MLVNKGVSFVLSELIVKRVERLCHNEHLVVDIKRQVEDINVAVELIYETLVDIIRLKKELERELKEEK
jgi:hypothetical protein